MHDMLAVNRLETGANVVGDVEGLTRRKPTHFTDESRQRVPLQKLHAQVGYALHLAQVVKAANVFVRDLLAEPKLSPEPGKRFRIVGLILPNHFQRDRAVELAVVRLVDDAHPALAHVVDDGVTRAESLSGGVRESRRRGRRRPFMWSVQQRYYRYGTLTRLIHVVELFRSLVCGSDTGDFI